jgi:hypothetical protein
MNIEDLEARIQAALTTIDAMFESMPCGALASAL